MKLPFVIVVVKASRNRQENFTLINPQNTFISFLRWVLNSQHDFRLIFIPPSWLEKKRKVWIQFFFFKDNRKPFKLIFLCNLSKIVIFIRRLN